MPRGFNYTNPIYGDILLGPGNTPCDVQGGPGDVPLTEYILSEFDIDFSNNIPGSVLHEYDIKSQDALQVFKLSLLAESDGATFKEVYLNGDGTAIGFTVGEGDGNVSDTLLHTQTILNESEKINHVVAHGKAPMPERKHKDPVDIMGNGGPRQFTFSCPLMYNPKNETFRKEAWVEFERSEHSQETKDALKAAVSRENWESLVGYRAEFGSISLWMTMNVSPTSPDAFGITVSDETTVPVYFDNTPDSGGVVDISGITMASAPVLDIRLGSELAEIAAGLGISNLEQDSIGYYDPEAWYVLLSHECGMNSLSRGSNWFLLPTSDPWQGMLLARRISSYGIAEAALHGIPYDSYGLRPTIPYRSAGPFIATFDDVMNANAQDGVPLLGTNFGVCFANTGHGKLMAGIGGNLGLEVFGWDCMYTKQTPSIQVRSNSSDAWVGAQSIAAAGVFYVPIVVVEEPAGVGLAPDGGPVLPVPPPDDETATYCPETPLDVLTGSVIEVSTPWLNGDGAQGFATNLYNLILADTTSAKVSTYAMGGSAAGVFPGMGSDSGIIHSVEFGYADSDSQTVTITTGPKFYQPGGAGSDSRYIKRSETLTKPGRVIGGSNEAGIFSVQIDGLGIYEAINGQIDTVFPGDRVDVKILNYPVER